jgi:SAM-dependent methyltransferase
MYSKRVKSRPYDEVSATIKAVAKPLLETGDEYHITHAARLAYTLEVLYREGVAEGGRVLELGTTGFFPIAVESLFPGVAIDVTNFDGAWALIESFVKDPVSQVVCELAGKSAAVTAFSIDLEYDVIPAEDETYDVVLCCEVLEHMEIDPMHMLSEVNRVLKTGGKLIMTTPNILSSQAWAKMLAGYAPHFFMQYHKSREYHRHNYEYGVREVHNILTSAGFDPKIWTKDLFEDGFPAVVKSLTDAGFHIENVGDNIIAVATKVSGVVERFPHGLYV